MFWLYGKHMVPMKVLRVEASEAFLRDQKKKRRARKNTFVVREILSNILALHSRQPWPAEP